MSEVFQRQIEMLEAQLLQLRTKVAGILPSAGTAPLASDAAAALAPIHTLLADDAISDILINSVHSVYIERAGKLEKTDIRFPDERAVFAAAQAIAAQVGRQLDPRRPLLDARLLDGSRVSIAGPPVAVDGTTISIRKFTHMGLTLDRMVMQENVSAMVAEFLKIVARCRINIIISGGTGSGKTTLLNAISQHIDSDERIITIEDAAELKLLQPHVVRLETMPLRIGGAAGEEVSMRELVIRALRMRPNRIIVGEVRGPEGFDMLQAMNTGHEGSLTTIHANHPRDALARLENMIAMADLSINATAIRQQIASAIHLIIQTSRMRDGHRRITHITEVVGIEGDTITMQELFNYTIRGEQDNGRLIGDFKWSGIMPRFLRRVAYYGESAHMAQVFGMKALR